MIIIEVQGGVVTHVSTDDIDILNDQSLFVVDWDNKEDEDGVRWRVGGPMFEPMTYDALRAIADDMIRGATLGTLENIITDHIKRQGQLTNSFSPESFPSPNSQENTG